MSLIYLVGPRACGKTTLGKALSEVLDVPYCDTDHHLCERLGMDVATMVERWVFFLSAPVEVRAARLRRNPLEAQRPSLTGKSLDDEVREVLEARLPLYRDAAHHELDARQSITELCLAVRTLLRR